MRIIPGAVTIATMLLAALPAAATPPVLVNDTSRPTVVTVTDAFFTHSTEYGVPIDVACVGFVQNGGKTAKQVGLSLPSAPCANVHRFRA